MQTTPKGQAGHVQAVLDTTVLSNFAAVNQCSVLQTIYEARARTTLMVAEELQRGLEAGYTYLDAALDPTMLRPGGWLPVLALEAVPEQGPYAELAAILGSGEAACLAVAFTRGMVLAADDLAARRLAVQRGVRLTGTLGILIHGVRAGHLTVASANEMLERMLQLGYRAPTRRLDELI